MVRAGASSEITATHWTKHNRVLGVLAQTRGPGSGGRLGLVVGRLRWHTFVGFAGLLKLLRHGNDMCLFDHLLRSRSLTTFFKPSRLQMTCRSCSILFASCSANKLTCKSTCA